MTKAIFTITIRGNPNEKKIGSRNLTGLTTDPINAKKIAIIENILIVSRMLLRNEVRIMMCRKVSDKVRFYK